MKFWLESAVIMKTKKYICMKIVFVHSFFFYIIFILSVLFVGLVMESVAYCRVVFSSRIVLHDEYVNIFLWYVNAAYFENIFYFCPS
jgi:hypothetical protein